MKERWKTLAAEYGKIAIVIYFSIYGLVFVGAALAIRAGIQSEGAATWAGTLGGAYVTLKVSQPLRILATLALTPLVARYFRAR